jgi:putative SOS response-associated peptidase YedK
MCGRFTQAYTWRELVALYGLTGIARNLEPHYNVAPTDTVDAIIEREGSRALASMRWGLIPWWWTKPLKEHSGSFNARAETVANKPMFRDAFRRSRCVIPASGYYEWLPTTAGKQPYYITSADGAVLSFAGLRDEWRNPETGDKLASCTVIVTDANELTRSSHDRMPVVLAGRDLGQWLSGAAGIEVLRPAPNDALRLWPVSRRVNRPGQEDDASLIEPLKDHASVARPAAAGGS